jgi:anti-sigma factor RsiW
MNHLSEEQLNEYLDHESADRVQIELHVSSCDECAARLAMLQTLFTELEELPELALPRDLAAPVMRRVGWPGVLPAWLTLTLAVQSALAIITALIAAPFMIEFASQSMPVLQLPGITETFLQFQTQWMAWQETISSFQMPVLPPIPTLQLSSLLILSTLTGASILWLVGNGLLLRNQIK